MSTTLVNDISAGTLSVVFDTSKSTETVPPEFMTLGVIEELDLTGYLYPTPWLVGAVTILLDLDRSLVLEKIQKELLEQPEKMNHGSLGTYNQGCHDIMCKFASTTHRREGTVSREPDRAEKPREWAIWQFILSHRLHQKLVRGARLEIW